MEPTREQAEATILDLLARRDPGKTICPSDAARALGGDDGFRPLMPLVRDAARALVAAQRIEVTQSGRPVDLDAARGAIRFRALPPGALSAEQDRRAGLDAQGRPPAEASAGGRSGRCWGISGRAGSARTGSGGFRTSR